MRITRRRLELVRNLQQRARRVLKAKRESREVCPISRERIPLVRRFGIVRGRKKHYYDCRYLANYIDHSKRTQDPLTRQLMNSVELGRLQRRCKESGVRFAYMPSISRGLKRLGITTLRHHIDETMRAFKLMIWTISQLDPHMVPAYRELTTSPNEILRIAPLVYAASRPMYRSMLNSLDRMGRTIGGPASALCTSIVAIVKQLMIAYSRSELFFIFKAGQIRMSIRDYRSKIEYPFTHVCVFEMDEDVDISSLLYS